MKGEWGGGGCGTVHYKSDSYNTCKSRTEQNQTLLALQTTSRMTGDGGQLRHSHNVSVCRG